MKFSSPITISKNGILVKSKTYTYMVPWLYLVPFSGIVIERTSTTSSNNYMYNRVSKLEGFSYEEILAQWVNFKFPKGNLIVLSNINIQSKNIHFWAKIPKVDSQHFLKDIVVFHCKDKSEVIRLVDNISSTFADAYGFSNGNVITYNKED